MNANTIDRESDLCQMQESVMQTIKVECMYKMMEEQRKPPVFIKSKRKSIVGRIPQTGDRIKTADGGSGTVRSVFITDREFTLDVDMD